jgi:hypothetical protein
MNVKFTRTDLFLKKLYDETGVTENQAIDDALAVNYELVEEYHTFEDVKEALDTVSFSPSKRTVQAIMDYSKKTSKLQTAC